MSIIITIISIVVFILAAALTIAFPFLIAPWLGWMVNRYWDWCDRKMHGYL